MYRAVSMLPIYPERTAQSTCFVRTSVRFAELLSSVTTRGLARSTSSPESSRPTGRRFLREQSSVECACGVWTNGLAWSKIAQKFAVA